MLNRYKKRLLIPFLAPAVILYAVFYLYPAVQTLLLAFTSWDGVAAQIPFVGLGNFRRLLDDPVFHQTIGNTVYFTVLGAALLFPTALFLAFATSDRSLRGVKTMRFVILAPVTLSVVTAALLFKFLLNPSFGLVNESLRFVGLESLAQPWLGREAWAMPAVVVATVWHGIGIWMLFFSAAIGRVPPEVREAARVDGANAFQVFRHVVFPLIWDVTRILLILWIIQALQAFAFVYAMTGGGPLRATEVFATYLYEVTFSQFRFGYGAAIAVFMTAVILVATFLSAKVSKREEVTY